VFRVEYSVNSDNETMSGFDLGHLGVLTDLGSFNSSHCDPPKTMMIFLSLVGLLDGLRRLFQNSKTPYFEFVGTDSSFIIKFYRLADGYFSIFVDGEAAGTVPEHEIVTHISKVLVPSVSVLARKLSDSDAVKEDLNDACTDFLVMNSSG